MRAVAAKVDGASSNLLAGAKIHQAGAKCLPAAGADDGQIRRATSMHHNFALRVPSALIVRDPILLQLAAPLLAVLGNLPGIMPRMIAANNEVRARRLPSPADNLSCRVRWLRFGQR